MSGSHPAVSIVIPMYNCGKMLVPCLESIRSQSFDDFEVIIVNNRSDDGSVETARSYSDMDKRFRVFDNAEGGAGSSRNIGVSHAAGEYICFIDGDDRISNDCLEKLYAAAKENDADISVCGFDFYFLNNEKTKRGMRVPDRVYTRDEALSLLLGDTRMRFYLWAKLWRRTLFTEHGITIPDMYYEDAAVTPQLFWFANKVVSVSCCGYHYTRAFSVYTESRMTPQRVNDYVNTIPMIRLFLESQGSYEKFRRKLGVHIFHVYFAVPSMVRQCGENAKRPSRENINRARAKVRLSLKLSYARLSKLDLKKPVVE